ncbi:MAG: hypothetical protein KIS78_09465 [Labilithrix sp.]|nr:hypothetical protein [Labilithrix sp.]
MRTHLVVGIAVGLLTGACDGSDTGPAPKPISEKQSSGGSDGGSGGGGSSGDGSSGGDADPDAGGTIAPDVLASCGEMCDHTVSLSTDCPDDSATQCKALCRLVLTTFDAPCQQTAKAWYTCMKEHTTAAACNGGNVPTATAPAECGSQTTAYTACLQR